MHPHQVRFVFIQLKRPVVIPFLRYDVRSPRRLQLRFESAEIGDLRISEQLEAVLAPALLPRTSINHQMLLALREVRTSFVVLPSINA